MMHELINCIVYAGKEGGSGEVSWGIMWVIILGVVMAGVAAYALYKYRLRVN